METTVVSAFTAAVAAQPTHPLITFYDDATGERTELSGATLANWVAKSANLLRDGLGLGTGDVAGVRLPPHWQTAAVLLACWSAGLAVELAPSDEQLPVLFTAEVDLQKPNLADEVYALALAPLGLPFKPGPPVGTADYVIEVRGHGDHFGGGVVDPRSAALADGTTHAELVTRARATAVAPGSRVLIDAGVVTDPADWLVAPLLAGASMVLCRNLDPSRLTDRLTGERAVRLAG